MQATIEYSKPSPQDNFCVSYPIADEYGRKATLSIVQLENGFYGWYVPQWNGEYPLERGVRETFDTETDAIDTALSYLGMDGIRQV